MYSIAKRMEKKSRRLKHLKLTYDFFVKTDRAITGLEQSICAKLADYVILEQKYVLRNHTKENDIKKIENKITIKRFNDGYLVNLFIHVHHYSKFFFDIHNFIYHLSSTLNLEGGSVFVVNKQQDRPLRRPPPKKEPTSQPKEEQQVIKASFI